MVLDWLLLSTILSKNPGFDLQRSRFRTIRSVSGLFPGRKFAFGEAGCDRLIFPIPPFLLGETADLSASDFAEECIFQMTLAALSVKPGEQFVVVLIGHGERRDGMFRLCVSTSPQRRGEAWITLTQLKRVAEVCPGQITIISDSCCSGALKSPLWKLVCAVGPTELSDSLSLSEFGNIRGSAFALRALAEVACSQGLDIPLPRSTPRPVGDAVVQLPNSPPWHSFSSGNHTNHPPMNPSIQAFVEGMASFRHYLICCPRPEFVHHGFENQPWWENASLTLSRSLVDCIQLLPEGVDFLENHNSALEGSQTYWLNQTGGFYPPESSERPEEERSGPVVSLKEVVRAKQELSFLAPAFARMGSVSGGDFRDSKLCSEFLSSPNCMPPYKILNLWDTLRTRHLQSVIAQLVVGELDGTATASVVPFLWLSGTKGGELGATDVISSCQVLQEFGPRIATAYPPTASYTDKASIYWVAVHWERHVLDEEDLLKVIDHSIAKARSIVIIDV
ncbi:hypothetical protein C8R45DRAFT_233460 [Mycena sanguinolenta]|nr:hypothetical protein C8R45DRAFT_233460 [Mycena sanguinolenta]